MSIRASLGDYALYWCDQVCTAMCPPPCAIVLYRSWLDYQLTRTRHNTVTYFRVMYDPIMKCVIFPLSSCNSRYFHSASDPPAGPSSNVMASVPAGGVCRSSGCAHSYVKEQISGSVISRPGYVGVPEPWATGMSGMVADANLSSHACGNVDLSGTASAGGYVRSASEPGLLQRSRTLTLEQ